MLEVVTGPVKNWDVPKVMRAFQKLTEAINEMGDCTGINNGDLTDVSSHSKIGALKEVGNNSKKSVHINKLIKKFNDKIGAEPALSDFRLTQTLEPYELSCNIRSSHSMQVNK